MTWIDLKVRKPTIEDADENGEVLWRMTKNGVVSWPWDDTKDAVAWMRIPDFTPLPDPPEGYEILADYDAEPDSKAMFFSASNSAWKFRAWPNDKYAHDGIYAVPIKPPEPQYRPFANADEFRPFRERWWKAKEVALVHRTRYYDDQMHDNRTWQSRFTHFEFEDGTPFGVKIN